MQDFLIEAGFLYTVPRQCLMGKQNLITHSGAKIYIYL